MTRITIDSLVVEPGTRATGYVGAVNRVDGTTIGIPVIVVAGKKDGPVLLVDGAIHGDEPEGTLAILSLARKLDPQTLRGAFIGVPVMNVGAFEAMSRGNPRDTHTFDMNRMYPGRAKGFLTDRVAHAHNAHIGSLADMEISIHSGGNICYLAETIFVSANDPKSFELARAMGPEWPIVLETPHPVGTPMAAMLQRQKPALTVELGGSAATMPGVLNRVVATIENALVNVCRHYGMLDGEAQYAEALWRGRQKVVQAGRSGILSPAPEHRLKQPIQRGDVLLTITDLFGDTIEELQAPCDGTLFGMRTYPSVTAGDWALFCAEARFERLDL
jgi:predicted deacylase